jgi:hypothetical protein
MQEGSGGGLAELVLRMAEAKATAASLPRVDLHRDPRLDCPSEALSTLRNPQDEALAECHLERDRVSEPAHELLGPMNTEAVLSVAVPDSREQAAAGFAEPQQAAGKARRGTLPLLAALVLMGISAAWLMLSAEKLRFPDPSSVGFTGGTTQSGTRTKNSSLASASSASATPLPAVLVGESINIAQHAAGGAAGRFPDLDEIARVKTPDVPVRAALQTANATTAASAPREDGQVLQQEFVPAPDFAAGRVESETLKASESAARDQTAKQVSDREPERDDPPANELAAAGAQSLATEVTSSSAQGGGEESVAVITERKRMLDDEREKVDGLNRDLGTLKARAAAAQIEFDSQSTALAEQKRMLAQERERADGLSRDLAAVRAEIEALKASISAAAPAQAQTAKRLIDRELESTTGSGRDRAPASADSSLLARAEELLKQHDIGGARLVLQRAFEGGSMRAALLLGQTYDPRILASWRTRGIEGEPAKARELYLRAQASGMAEASAYLERLPR